MASLLLILSELVRPETANLLAVNYVLQGISPSSKDRPGGSIAAAAGAFERARGVVRRLSKTCSEGEDCDVFDEDLTDLKISVESVWP